MIIGIDPDMTKSGVCVLTELGFIKDLYTASIVDLNELIGNHKTATFVIEDVLKNKAVFTNSMSGTYKKVAKAQSVGKLKGAASIIIEFIEHHTGKPPLLAPIGVGKQLKNNANLFKHVTGYTGRTNADMRDAYCIARWGFSTGRIC